MNKFKPALWTRDFILTSLVNFFLVLIFYLLMVTIAVYAVTEYGASTSEAGLVTGIFILGALTGRIFIGRSIDKIGRKRTMIVGTTLFTLTTFFYFLNLGLPFLMANRFLHGMTLGMASTAAGTIVAQIIPMTRKGEGIGYFSMSSTLAAAFGPFIGLMLSQYSSYEMIFTVCLVLGVVSLIVSLLVYVPPVEAPPTTHVTKGFKVSGFIEPKAVPIAIICLVVALCYSSVLSFINFYANEENLVQAASYFFLVYAIAILLSRPFTGRLMDLKGANFIMYPAFVLFAAGLFLLNVSSSSAGLLVAGALIGFGFGNMQSTTQAVAIKLTPTHRMGLATSTFFIAMDAGLGFGPYLLGFIIPLIGYSSLYGILGFVVLATSILYYVLHGKKERANAVALGYK
ncbi:major facilitator superfamily MFS_1 [Planococcus donghaensis MPA1U2]|uniref:Major facilitator superfamily MFS_1 n=1 Tax=Planococcus donghaensis MPA1U2 TaxID=933115 RepID=E7RCF1_9BACL|nr:MFS transporter [Planococcus donghaensis]EGA91316.1 major facilitator superfamily MFS_1 [Planococcus donghaensis MPA1U2]